MHIFMQQYKQIKKIKYIYTNYVSNAENVQILPQNHRISSLLTKYFRKKTSLVMPGCFYIHTLYKFVLRVKKCVLCIW